MAEIKDKIERIHREILDEFRRRNETLLAICESPIEKLFLLHLMQYYYDSSVEINSFEYIFDIVEPIPDPQNPKNKILPSKPNFQEKGGGSFLFIKGLKIEDGSFSYQIFPQHSLNLDGRNLRLDFAILIESKGGKKNPTGKYCIECDGHEYHSTKYQITRDNERMRLLTKHGWTALRYSGSEIYSLTQIEISTLEDIILDSLQRIN